MDPKKLGDFAGRLKSGGKGFGTGIGFLAAAGALAYGVSQSIYTGNDGFENTCRLEVHPHFWCRPHAARCWLLILELLNLLLVIQF